MQSKIKMACTVLFPFHYAHNFVFLPSVAHFDHGPLVMVWQMRGAGPLSHPVCQALISQSCVVVQWLVVESQRIAVRAAPGAALYKDL